MKRFIMGVRWYELALAILGIALFCVSLGDTIISLKSPKSFDDVLAGDVAAGDHISGQVSFLLDSFASEQTWTENRSTGSVTPKKTSRRYYVLPAGEGYMGLSIGGTSMSDAEKLVDQTYGWLSGGALPTVELTADCRVVKMDQELAEMFVQEMEEYYGFSSQEIDDMGTILMAEPRSFRTIQVFCGIGGAMFLLGTLLLVRRWRKCNAVVDAL